MPKRPYNTIIIPQESETEARPPNRSMTLITMGLPEYNHALLQLIELKGSKPTRKWGDTR